MSKLTYSVNSAAFKFAVLLFLLITMGASCQKDDSDAHSVNADTISITGVIAEQGITTYQYGSHVLGNEEDFYAITSETIDLDQYIGDTVTVLGRKKPGYPLSNGPEYIEVIQVKP